MTRDPASDPSDRVLLPSRRLAYVELQVSSNFSFLRGASHPDELALAAGALGVKGFAVTDRNSMAGVVRAHMACKDAGLPFIVGCRLDLIRDARPEAQGQRRLTRVARTQARKPSGTERTATQALVEPQDARPGGSFLAYPTDRAAYGRLCRLLTLGRRRAPKGDCFIDLEDLRAHAEGMILIALPPPTIEADFMMRLIDLGRQWQGRLYLGAHHHLSGDDEARLSQLAAVADRTGVPMVALNDVHFHSRSRKPLQDVLTCIRHGCTVDTAGTRLFPNAERCLKTAEEMALLFSDHPDALARTVEIARRCTFSLDELRYEYPDELTQNGRNTAEELRHLAYEGAHQRYGAVVPERVVASIEHELALIGELKYEPYFLTVYDIVRFARSQGILCQGRGSAANSTVCFCLGITAVDPARVDLLFERFISAARDEPPDIDVDFEHERREEVIQYIYTKYGRDRAGLAATVISYRTRGAVRDVGKALGLSEDAIAAISSNISGWNESRSAAAPADEAEAQTTLPARTCRVLAHERLSEMGLDITSPRLAMALDLVQQIRGFPRHLSQHVGGFVLTRGPLSEYVPIANAAMQDRTVIEWDKDDLEALGLMKVDVLSLGMLSCMRRCFELLEHHYGAVHSLASIPSEDPAVYDMLSRGDSLGVFQVESRAQMNMLPRLKPATFYDLVVQVAIVRPGPIQGDMVHPYLRRRNGEEPVDYPSEELEKVLGKTLGVPLFQEQAMKIAIVAAGFTPTEADQLRRAMATFKKDGMLHQFGDKLRLGMAARGYDPEFADRCFKQIEGFGSYGFPESHAASFALLVYTSSWMKKHYPEVFACALLNSQPMGFYAPAQIIRDAREHGVEVLPPDVNASDWDNTLAFPTGRPVGLPSSRWPDTHPRAYAIRLGLRQVKGLKEEDAEKIVLARNNGYPDMLSLWRRSGASVAALETLARGDGYSSLGLGRREAFWAIKALPADPLPLFAAAAAEEWSDVAQGAENLPAMTVGEEVADDYRALRLSLKAHPMALLRDQLAAEGRLPSKALWTLKDGALVKLAGVVLVRQRPGSAKGVIFITLEDETGVANLVIWSDRFEAYRREVLSASLLEVWGRVQKSGEGDHQVIHITAQHLVDRSALLAEMQVGEGEPDMLDSPVTPPLAHADEIVRGMPDDPRQADIAGRHDDAQPLRAMGQRGHWGTGQGASRSVERQLNAPGGRGPKPKTYQEREAAITAARQAKKLRRRRGEPATPGPASDPVHGARASSLPNPLTNVGQPKTSRHPRDIALDVPTSPNRVKVTVAAQTPHTGHGAPNPFDAKPPRSRRGR